MASTLVRRTAVGGSAVAVLLGGGLISAPGASADGHSPVTQQTAPDQGPSPKKMVYLKDGCFTASYENDVWASVTLYFRNHCSRAHKLRINPTGSGGHDQIVTVSGHTKGSKRYWNWTTGFDIDDKGRA